MLDPVGYAEMNPTNSPQLFREDVPIIRFERAFKTQADLDLKRATQDPVNSFTVVFDIEVISNC
jgi:hypothetical protein